MDGLLERLLDALAGLVHHPTVVHAAQAVLFRDAVGEIDPAMRAEAFDEPECTGLVAIEDEVFAEDTDGTGGSGVQLSGYGDRMPVAAHQFAHRCAGAHTCEPFVLSR